MGNNKLLLAFILIYTNSFCASSDITKDLYLDLIREYLINSIYADKSLVIDPPVYMSNETIIYATNTREDGSNWPTLAHTVIGLKRLNNIQFSVQDILKNNISQDLTETEVWRGGATIFIHAILANGITNCKVWVPDSFEGLSVPNAQLYPADRVLALSAAKVPYEKFVLITSLYNEKDDTRAKEYLYCLNRNLNHPGIGKVHVVYDVSNDDGKNRILNYLKANTLISISYRRGRPTFNYLFDLANGMYGGKKIILSNADIYFEHSLNLLLNYSLSGKLLSLTRCEVLPNNRLLSYAGSNGPYGADTWIFTTPLEKFKNCNFELGTSGCDGMLIYQAYKSNLTTLNPCIDIKCCHLHISGVRHWNIIHRTEGMAWLRGGKLNDKKGDFVIIQHPK